MLSFRSPNQDSVPPATAIFKKLYRYDIVDENFASGCFGKIFLALNSTGQQVVIKQIPKNGNNSSEVKKEIEAGKKLKHSNITKFIEHFSNNEFDFLVFERIHGLDLYSTIERRKFEPFTDSQCRRMFKQMMKAIRYIHDNNIVHRDIKLENILMDSNGHITLLDFGLCDIVQLGKHSERFCGSIDYVAPEVLSRRSYDGFKSDVFSLGVVLYTILFAEFPFISADRVNAIKSGNLLPKPKFCPKKMLRFSTDPLAKELIEMMLKEDPKERFSMNQVMNHEWVKKNGIVKSSITPLSSSSS